MLRTIFIKCKVDVVYLFLFLFRPPYKIFSEKVRKPINKNNV